MFMKNLGLFSHTIVDCFLGLRGRLKSATYFVAITQTSYLALFKRPLRSMLQRDGDQKACKRPLRSIEDGLHTPPPPVSCS